MLKQLLHNLSMHTHTAPAALWFDLPRHNDDVFHPDTYRAKVATLAAKWSAAELAAAIADCEASRARDHGVEFDDVRSRHKTGKAISALQAALALQAVRS